MKRVKNRAGAALLLAVFLIAGIGLYVSRLYRDGAAWASFSANQTVYSDGALNLGTVTDRNGVVLAASRDGIYYYADDAAVRAACLHAVGDYSGNVGTGALKVFSDNIIGYNAVDGVYSKDGSGGTVKLTIDSSLNAAAYAALSGRNGAVMVMDYETGEVICMVSAPSYDPQNVPDLSLEAYEGVYINRCLNGLYAPGSVFKLITLCAAIENIDDLFTRQFTCTGSFVTSGVEIKCSGIHGTQTIEQAIGNSCNCAFGQISLELGGETIAKYAKALGITTSNTISGIETEAGRYDVSDSGSADLAWSGIGQSSDLVSPFAMLRISAGIANGGLLVSPRLLMDEKSDSERIIDASTAKEMADMMDYTATWAYGPDRFPGLDISAKSGTAELGDGTSHAWFTGYIEDEDHPYAFVVIVERGGGGLSVAGAVANTVLQAAVNR